MKIYLLLVALLFSKPDWNTYNPDAKFEVGKYYKNPYTQVIFIRELQILHDGSSVFIVENVVGRAFCQWPHKVCDMPTNIKRGSWLEVERLD